MIGLTHLTGGGGSGDVSGRSAKPGEGVSRVGAPTAPRSNGVDQPAERSWPFWKRMVGNRGGGGESPAAEAAAPVATAPAPVATAPPPMNAADAADALHSTDGYAELTEQADDTRDDVISDSLASNKRFQEMMESGDDAALQRQIEADLEGFRRGEQPKL